MLEHIEKLKREYEEYKNGNLVLGKKPKDLEEVLTNLIIASPANCIYRYTQDSYIATNLARKFIALFNSQEAMAIIDICFGGEIVYWKKVLK